jgi:hypothetical protein
MKWMLGSRDWDINRLITGEATVIVSSEFFVAPLYSRKVIKSAKGFSS